MEDEEEPHPAPAKREIAMAARATIELFGNGAVSKTRERLDEVKAEGNQQSIVEYWQRGSAGGIHSIAATVRGQGFVMPAGHRFGPTLWR
jgi:hypothetical protein